MLLSDKYFQGQLFLPNLKYSGAAVGYDVATQISADNTLDWFIAVYEIEFLRLLLGDALADNFMEGIKGAKPLQIWVDLRDVIYRAELVGSKTFHFSPAANYVYFYAKRDSATTSTMKGEVRDTQDHALVVSDAKKLVKAWNGIDPQAERIYKFLSDNWNDYKEYSGGGLCRHRFGLINTFGI